MKPKPRLFTGGLNLTQPAILLNASDLIYCKNMEPSLYGGYKQVAGFERYDGNTKPSETVYSGITADEYYYETAENKVLYDAQRETNRDAIAAVPGSGDVQGVVIYNDEVLAFRSNGSITKCYKSSGSGWSEIAAFTNEALTVGGVFQFAVHNFGAGPKLYGVDGVNPPWEWDGTTFDDLVGLAAATTEPKYIAGHNDVLFIGYTNSIAHCTVGDPTDWTTAALEINVRDTVTGITHLLGGLLIVFCENSTHILYGKVGTFELKVHSDNAGAQAYSVASETTPIFLSDQGVTSLQATQNYGDFQTGSFTNKILPWLQKYKALAVGAALDLKGKMYRLYFSDGRVLNLGYNGQEAGDALMSEYGVGFTCATNGEINNKKVIFCGADDGFVYQMEVGNCLDGAVIPVIFKTAFDNCESPQYMKSFYYMEMLVDAPDEVDVTFAPDFSYGSDISPAASAESSATSGGGAWDVSDWDSFFWSEESVGKAEGYMDGKGENYNISLVVSLDPKYTRPINFQSLTFFYEKHGIKR